MNKTWILKLEYISTWIRRSPIQYLEATCSVGHFFRFCFFFCFYFSLSPMNRSKRTLPLCQLCTYNSKVWLCKRYLLWKHYSHRYVRCVHPKYHAHSTDIKNSVPLLNQNVTNTHMRESCRVLFV
jgi:hypothetical protein